VEGRTLTCWEWSEKQDTRRESERKSDFFMKLAKSERETARPEREKSGGCVGSG